MISYERFAYKYSRYSASKGAANTIKSIRIHVLLFLFTCSIISLNCFAAGLPDSGIYLIPYPQKVVIGGESFIFPDKVDIIADKGHSAADRFTADELARDLKTEWNVDATVNGNKAGFSIVLRRRNGLANINNEGYEISTGRKVVTISASGEEGLFYGTQTLLQLIKKDGRVHKIPALKITDWPDIRERAIHYDTKHHQDKLSYVKSFIKELARYKINILVWEWEDKFAYPSHPEIGAPGAFTMQEIQGLTDYARKYHVQVAPLVQGLGHVSFILKWPQFAQYREIPASNFEFCPLKDGSYDLLFDLWKDAMEATKGSSYIHIGSDETYELGLCEQCKAKAAEIGKKGLYHLFSDRAAKYILSKGRKPMIWETSMGWEKGNPIRKVEPNKGLVLTEEMGEVGVESVKKAKSLGYKVFFYDPNPGIEPLFLPYFYKENDNREREPGCLEHSYDFLTKAATSGVFDGMIRTSWDDAGLHNQEWMLSFLASANYSWNGHAPALGEFTQTFFQNYYGPDATGMEKLFYFLNESAYYYWDTFERKVWHFGDVGKVFLPDLPRSDDLEYNVYWNKQNKDMVNRSRLILAKMDSACLIIAANKRPGVKHQYDLDIFESLVNLTRHTCHTYIDLSAMENAITRAQDLTFVNRDSAYASLQDAQHIVEENLKRRSAVLNNLVATWEQTRLPKGMSLPGNKYFYQQDRTRHFANRKPDMSYFVFDEELLDLEGWLDKLKAYMVKYKANSF